MADVPDEFLDGMEAGFFPANAADNWLRNDASPADRAEIEAFMDANLSMEWAFAAADAGLPDPSEWDHVTIERDGDGSWDVTILAGDTAVTIDAAASDEIAADTIWGDFWFHVIDEYDIDVDKEISYADKT